jgi:ribulose-phosphate 3-epimerase
MKVVPSILAEKFDDFLVRLRQAESFTDFVQIDIMDGDFVETRSFPIERINSVGTSLNYEVHLMVKDPLSFLSKIDHPGLRKVIFHFEAETGRQDLVKRIKERGLAAGMAIKPETALSEFRNVAEQVDTLLFLTVDPCCYGSPFKSEVLPKLAEARRIFPDRTIAVDGGVSLDNLKTFIDLGVDYVCVGSRIFLRSDPAENYSLFMQKLRSLEASRG